MIKIWNTIEDRSLNEQNTCIHKLIAYKNKWLQKNELHPVGLEKNFFQKNGKIFEANLNAKCMSKVDIKIKRTIFLKCFLLRTWWRASDEERK